MTRRVVVTGASGFIAGALVAALRREGSDAVAVARRAGSGIVRVGDYAALEGDPGACLVHLAGPRDIGAVDASPPAERERVVALVSSLLERPWGHVIFASSAAVFSSRVARARGVAETPDGVGGYAETKQRCEAAVLAAGGAVARLANVYGRGMARTNVVSEVLAQIPGKGPLTVRDAGAVVDLVWIDDAAAGLAALAGARTAGIHHLGSGAGTSVGDLARAALAAAGEAGREVRSSAASSRGSHRVLALEPGLGWRPRTTLDAGLHALVGTRR